MDLQHSTPSEPLAPPAMGEPYLLTPGPLTTALSVKQAMLRDWGSWDASFNAITATICKDVVDVVNGAMGRRMPGFSSLDDTDQAILASLAAGKGRPTSEIAEAIALTPRATRTRLARLVGRGLVREIGTGPQDPQRRYYLADRGPA